FADAAHHDAAPAREDQADRIEEALVEARAERAYGIGLDREHLARKLECRRRYRFFRPIVHRMETCWSARVAPFMIGRGVYQTDSAIFLSEAGKTRTSKWAGRSSWC